MKTRSPWKAFYFLDTEFTNFLDTELISLAIVGENGSEFYGEVTDFRRGACSAFVQEAVLPQPGQFPGRAMSFAQLRSQLLAWVSRIPLKPKPVLCFDFQGDVDLLDDLLWGVRGSMPGWQMENVNSWLDAERLEAYYREHGGRHHALHDARANAFAFRG
jgi:hypothetical protein